MTPRQHEDDPIRWRDLPAADAPNRNDVAGSEKVESALATATRILARSLPPDDLRLAQIRSGLALRLAQDRLAVPPMLRRPFRIAVLVIASVGLGGVATAVTGRILGWRRATGTKPAPGAVITPTPTTTGREPRRWRVAVDAPAKLDLTIGPAGTELAVVEGRAHIAPADGAEGGGVTVEPGGTWPGGVQGIPRDGVPESHPSSEPARVPAESPPVKTSSPRGARAPRPARRTVALAAPADTEGPPAPEALMAPPPTTAGDASPLAPPRFEPRVAPVDRAPAAAASAPRGSGAGALSIPLSLRQPPASAPPPAALESSSEAAMLMNAFRRLRTEHDPIGALALIDAYDHVFERRGMAREAALARAEALLALGRKSAALTVLDGLSLSGSSLDRRAALARAELRAADGRRAADALRDFDHVLETGAGDELAARALYGRAVVREAAGDVAGARADLQDYLKRFADDTRRSDVKLMLDRLGR